MKQAAYLKLTDIMRHCRNEENCILRTQRYNAPLQKCYEIRPEVVSRGSSSVTATILEDATTHAKLIPKRYYSTTYLQLQHHYALFCYSAHWASPRPTLFAQARNQHNVAEGNL